MPRHRRIKPNLDERFDLPQDTDPDEVLRRLMGVPGPVESHEEPEGPGQEDETGDS